MKEINICCGGLKTLMDWGVVHVNVNDAIVLNTRDHNNDKHFSGMILKYCPWCGKKVDEKV